MKGGRLYFKAVHEFTERGERDGKERASVYIIIMMCMHVHVL